MDSMLSELTLFGFGSQRRLLLPLYSGKHALQGEGETVVLRLAKPSDIICEGITKKTPQNKMYTEAHLVIQLAIPRGKSDILLFANGDICSRSACGICH